MLRSVLADLSNRGVRVYITGDDLKLRGKSSAITSADVEILRKYKPALIQLVRLTGGLPLDDDAADLLAMDEVDPADVPICESCARLCDVQTLDDAWHCSRCDPRASERRERTDKLIRLAKRIRSTQ